MAQRIRQKIWFEIEETERMLRYLSPVKDRCIVKKSKLRNIQCVLSAILLVVTPITSWASVNTPWFWALFIIQLVAVIGLFYSFMATRYRNLSSIVEVLDKVLNRSKEVAKEMADLWDSSERSKVKADSAILIIEQLAKRREVLESLVMSGYGLTVDEELNIKSTNEAKQYMEGTFAKVHFTS